MWGSDISPSSLCLCASVSLWLFLPGTWHVIAIYDVGSPISAR